MILTDSVVKILRTDYRWEDDIKELDHISPAGGFSVRFGKNHFLYITSPSTTQNSPSVALEDSTSCLLATAFASRLEDGSPMSNLSAATKGSPI